MYQISSGEGYNLFGNYVNDTLQFLPTEEGRVRFNVVNSSLQYDYFIKDHLGNVRMILTEQTQTDPYPVASLENSTIANERLYYCKVDSGRVNKSTVSGYPNDTYTSPNDYIQKLNGNGTKIGTGIVLKVMAGDKFNLRVNSWWNSGNTPNTPVNPLNDLLSALNGGVSGASGGHYTTTDLSNNSALNPGATDFLNSHTGYSTTIPKAFVNWALFDEQFKFVSSSSGFEQVGSSNTFATHTRTNVSINKSGYLYVYVSNETPNIDVFFDNLQVTHIRCPLISDEAFYPYGERMFNLCDRALNFGDPENKKKKFQGQEYNDDLGVDMYEFKYRMDDPQIGRFWQIDPLANDYVYNSTYAFSEDKVIRYVELEGLEIADPMVNWIIAAFMGFSNDVNNSVGATERISTGTSGGEGISHLPSQVQGTVKTIATLNDVNTMTKPYVDIYQGINAAASFLPVGEAGIFEDVGANVVGKGVFPEAANSEGNLALKSSTTEASKGLGNPFKNSTLKEVDQAMQKQVQNGKLVEKPSAPGSKTYQNTKSGYSYNLDPGKQYKKGLEKPHVDVNYPKPKPKNIPEKKKLDVSGGF